MAEPKACTVKKDSWSFYGERFAVREACLKALKLGFTGVGIDLAPREAEHSPLGYVRITLRLQRWVARFAEKRRIQVWRVSAGYCHNYAIAAVVLLGASLDGNERKLAPQAPVIG